MICGVIGPAQILVVVIIVLIILFILLIARLLHM
jgi:Sec-independent protein translocase protein TatA